MNIDYRTGDLLSADAEALVNTVNCVGVMGKGIALQFKKAFPDNFKNYSIACERKQVRPGEMFVTEQFVGSPRYIINFPTKRHWRARSRLSDVESGLTALADQIRKRDIRSIAMPALGCGHGGLEWEEVRSLIERELGELSGDVRIVVFEPEGTSGAKSVNRSVEVPEMTSGRAALVMLMDRYLSGQPGKARMLPETTVHELIYFLQAAGEPLKLGYSKGNGDPYAEGLGRVLRKMEGHWISGRRNARSESGNLLGLIPGAAEDAEVFLADRPDTRGRVSRVGDLMDGFETSSGVELLANVHWVVHNERAVSVDDVARHLRGRRFYRKQVEQAYQTLESLGWLHDEERSNREIGEEPVLPTEADAFPDMVSEHRGDLPARDESFIPINVNTASVDDLETLPRVGDKLAQAIVTYRDGHGPFHAASDITRVPGIGNPSYSWWVRGC